MSNGPQLNKESAVFIEQGIPLNMESGVSLKQGVPAEPRVRGLK